MKATIVDYLFVRNGKGRLTLDLDEDFRKQYDNLKGSEVEVSIKKYFPARSRDANAYAWVLITKIAEKMNEPKIETYRRYIRDCGGKTTVSCVKTADMETEIQTFLDGHIGRVVDVGESKIPECVVIFKHYGSSSFDSQEMNRFIASLSEDCRLLGIEVKPQEEINSLLKEWNNGRKA